GRRGDLGGAARVVAVLVTLDLHGRQGGGGPGGRGELRVVGLDGGAGRIDGRDTLEREAAHDQQPGDVVRRVAAVRAGGPPRRAEAVPAVPGAQGRRSDPDAP